MSPDLLAACEEAKRACRAMREEETRVRANPRERGQYERLWELWMRRRNEATKLFSAEYLDVPR